MTCTPEQPHLLVDAHSFSTRVEDRRKVMDAAGINGVHPPCNVRCVSTSHITAIAAVGSHAAGPAASCFASIAPSMLPLPCLARHAAPRLAAPGYAGAAPLCCALYRTPRNPNARPARPAAFACMVCVCVCVGWCDVMSLVDVFLAFGSAVVCYSVASAFCWFARCFAFVLGFVFGCSCGSLLAVRARCCPGLSTRPTHGTHSPHTPHKLHTHHAISTRPIYTTHHIHHANTSHHTPLFLAHMQV